VPKQSADLSRESSRPSHSGKLHGYGVLLRIQQISGEGLVIQQGSLYPALYRLEHDGDLSGELGESENKRRARYSFTPRGRRRFTAETEKWNRFVGIMGSILSVTEVQQ